MKLSKIALAVGALVISGAAAAEFSANIAATSNYVWRGATQTDDNAAIQGGIDYAHDSGFYLGTWASNVDFGAGGEVEVDLYGGFSGEMGGLGYDIGLIYYAYPDSDDANFTEIALGVSYAMFSAGINYTIDSEVNDAAGSAEAFIDGDLYYYVGASFEVAPTWTLGATVGYYDFEDDGVGGTDLSYTHYQLDVSKSAGDFGDFTFSVSKAGDEANSDALGNPDDDIKVFVSWAKTF